MVFDIGNFVSQKYPYESVPIFPAMGAGMGALNEWEDAYKKITSGNDETKAKRLRAMSDYRGRMVPENIPMSPGSPMVPERQREINQSGSPDWYQNAYALGMVPDEYASWMGFDAPERQQQPQMTAQDLAILNRTLGTGQQAAPLGPNLNGDVRESSGWNPWTGKNEGGPIRPTQNGVPTRTDAPYEDAQTMGQRGPVDPRKAIPQARAIQDAEAARRRNNQGLDAGTPRNPWDVFGAGGGDWASAWQNAQKKPQSLEGSLIGNQLSAFLNYDNNLDKQYNSPVGAYGQLQSALTQQRPYKAQENVAQIQADAEKYMADSKAKTALGLASYLGGPFRGSPTSISTDYGASVTPTYQSYRARRK